MKVSVIVPVYNDTRIASCLASLLEQDYSRELYEIIAVDNGSDIPIKEIIHSFQVHYVQEDRKGSYFARNKGLEVAQGEIAAFIDADCIADPAWLRNLVVYFEDERIGGVGGKILKSPAETWVQRAAEDLAEQQLLPQSFPFLPYPYIVTANAAYRMSILHELKGFDSQFQSGGDVDLAQRVQCHNYRIVTVPDAIVYHAPRRTFKGYFNQYFSYAVGHTQLFRKYRKSMNMLLFINTYPLRELLLLILRWMMSLMPFACSSNHVTTSLPGEFLKLVKYVALIYGNLYGSVMHRVLFL